MKFTDSVQFEEETDLDDGKWVRLLACEALAPGEMLGLDVGDQRLAIYNIEGTYHVTDNICTHAFAILSDGWLEDGVIECPLHSARFDVASGRVLSEPATCDLKTYPVRVVDGHVEATVPI
jgi:nitrite reductase/ring-hydroxylating ferredoxin subunit